MIDKDGEVDNGVNKANIICIWLTLSGSGQYRPYIVSNVLVLVTRVGDINFPLIQNIQCYKAYNSIITLYC